MIFFVGKLLFYFFEKCCRQFHVFFSYVFRCYLSACAISTSRISGDVSISCRKSRAMFVLTLSLNVRFNQIICLFDLVLIFVGL